jgi:hypothetical protein
LMADFPETRQKSQKKTAKNQNHATLLLLF